MSSEGRIDDFSGCDDDYIRYLESKVQECRADHSSACQISTNKDKDKDNGLSVQFVSYENQIAKRARIGKCRWQSDMDEFLLDIPVAESWEAKRKYYMLASLVENRDAVNLLVNNPNATASGAEKLHFLGSEFSLLQRAKAYAHLTQGSQIEGRFRTKIGCFQELVLTSLCAVMVQSGYSKDSIESVMRVYISKSNPKHLERLRQGAVWVNRVIGRL